MGEAASLYDSSRTPASPPACNREGHDVRSTAVTASGKQREPEEVTVGGIWAPGL